jgi:hypothetical protein
VAVVAAAVRAYMSNRRIVYRSHAHAALLVAVVVMVAAGAGQRDDHVDDKTPAALIHPPLHGACVCRACLALVSRWLWLGSPGVRHDWTEPPHGGVSWRAVDQMADKLFCGNIAGVPPSRLPPQGSLRVKGRA